MSGYHLVYSPQVEPGEEQATATNGKQTADILSRVNIDPQLLECVVECFYLYFYLSSIFLYFDLFQF